MPCSLKLEYLAAVIIVPFVSASTSYKHDSHSALHAPSEPLFHTSTPARPPWDGPDQRRRAQSSVVPATSVPSLSTSSLLVTPPPHPPPPPPSLATKKKKSLTTRGQRSLAPFRSVFFFWFWLLCRCRPKAPRRETKAPTAPATQRRARAQTLRGSRVWCANKIDKRTHTSPSRVGNCARVLRR